MRGILWINKRAFPILKIFQMPFDSPTDSVYYYELLLRENTIYRCEGKNYNNSLQNGNIFAA